MENIDKQSDIKLLNAESKRQDSSGGTIIGGAFELATESQILFVATGSCSGARYVQHEIHLDNLTNGTTMQIAGAGLSRNYPSEHSQVTSHLILPKGAYRWTARYVVFLPQGKLDAASQTGYAIVSGYPITLRSYGINEVFSLVSGPNLQKMNALGFFRCILPPGYWMSAQVASTDLKTGFVIDTPNVKTDSTRLANYDITTQVLPFIYKKDTLFKVKLTVDTSVGPGQMNGAILDMYS